MLKIISIIFTNSLIIVITYELHLYVAISKMTLPSNVFFCFFSSTFLLITVRKDIKLLVILFITIDERTFKKGDECSYMLSYINIS